MNDALIRRFCESRYRWLIVTSVTIVLGLATLAPAADEYFDKRNVCDDLAHELILARNKAELLPRTRQQADDAKKQLAAFESRAIDQSGVPAFRSRIVELVRDSGCQIRRINLGEAASRPWIEGDDPLAGPVKPRAGQATPFALERRNVTLIVDGSMDAVHTLLERLEQQRAIAHPRRVKLQSSSRGGQTVTLELELWLFALGSKSR